MLVFVCMFGRFSTFSTTAFIVTRYSVDLNQYTNIFYRICAQFSLFSITFAACVSCLFFLPLVFFSFQCIISLCHTRFHFDLFLFLCLHTDDGFRQARTFVRYHLSIYVYIHTDSIRVHIFWPSKHWITFKPNGVPQIIYQILLGTIYFDEQKI